MTGKQSVKLWWVIFQYEAGLSAETLRQGVGYTEVEYEGFQSIMFSVKDVNSILDSFLLLKYK